MKQQARTVRQTDLLEIERRVFLAHTLHHRGRRVLRIRRNHRQILRHEISLHHAAQAGRRQRKEPLEVGAVVINVAHDHFTGPETRGLSRHRLAHVHLGSDRLPHGFRERLGADAFLRHAGEFTQNRLLGGEPLVRISQVGNIEQTTRARTPRHRIDAVNEAVFFANSLPENGTVAVTEHHREHVERRRIRMRQTGNLPTEPGPGNLHVFKKMLVTARELSGFIRHQDRSQTLARRFAEMFGNRGPRRSRIEIPCDDEHEIVGHVTGAIISNQIVTRGRGENVAVPDDRLPVRMRAKRSFKQRLPEPLIGIIQTHVDLAQNHFLFLRHFLGGQGRTQHCVGQEVDRHAGVLGRKIDIIHRAIKRRVSVDVSAMRLNGGGNLAARPALGALEKHVL